MRHTYNLNATSAPWKIYRKLVWSGRGAVMTVRGWLGVGAACHGPPAWRRQILEHGLGGVLVVSTRSGLKHQRLEAVRGIMGCGDRQSRSPVTPERRVVLWQIRGNGNVVEPAVRQTPPSVHEIAVVANGKSGQNILGYTAPDLGCPERFQGQHIPMTGRVAQPSGMENIFRLLRGYGNVIALTLGWHGTVHYSPLCFMAPFAVGYRLATEHRYLLHIDRPGCAHRTVGLDGFPGDT
ncbi:hypothetical protein DFH06DRAFT_1142842 [Mycena polygramma]|nr:hypothetical protein DFH06DRAFT_1142842 [Mycena polygramma]